MKLLYLLISNITRHAFAISLSVFIILSPLGNVFAKSESPINSEVQQNLRVTGKVSSETDNLELPGVSIVIKGTSRGTVTDYDGNFSLEVPDLNSILIFSFIGYQSKEVPVGGQTVLNVILTESIEALDEVVVTALGISRKEKSLGFSVGKVDGNDMNKIASENALNALAGKVAGVQINSTGGTGSSVSMVIRGGTSLANDNQPLFVIDGVPVVNSLNNISGFGSGNIVDYGNAISDLNAEDIENVSVLKGPSAAALYGSRAGNGVVLITTKSGKNSDGIRVNVSSNTVFDKPYKYFKSQKKSATGYFSYNPDDLHTGTVFTINPAESSSAGMETDKGYFAVQWNSPYDANGVQVPTEVVSYPDNVENFVRTGITTTNGVSITNNNEEMNYRFSFTNMSSGGVIPNSDIYRNNLTVASSLKIRENITFSTNINYVQSWSDNRPASNRDANPLAWAYRVPLNTNIYDLKDYWEPGQEGLQQRVPRLPSQSASESEYNNPYFLANEVKNSFDRDRIYGNVHADWQITPEWSLMGRYSLDKYNEQRESKIAPSYTNERNNGAYGIANIMNYERNIDFLLTYDKRQDNFSYTLSLGGNALYRKGTSVSNASKESAGLIVPNVYTINNIASGKLDYSSSWYQKEVYSLYGMANLGWKDMIFLDLTARNDWSSTLPRDNWSYFYPSASVSLLINEMTDLGDRINLLKLRGGWAKVGNDTDPYMLYSTYNDAGQWGESVRYSKSGTRLIPNLKPEEFTSWEIGLDLGLYDQRLRFEGTWYSGENKNQILSNIPVTSSSGYDQININAGLVETKGIELTLGGTPVQSKNWTWDLNMNFSRNRTKLIELSEGVDVVEFWSDAKGGSWTYEGDEIGSIYDAKILTVEDKDSPYYGYPIIGTESYEWQAVEFDQTRNKIGDYNPDFMLGLQTSLRFKAFTLNMTFDWRCGGQFISQTYRYMSEWTNTEKWMDDLINPEGRSGAELRDWLVANEDKYIKNGFHVIGGPTKEYGGFPETFSGNTVHDGVFVPGVVLVDGVYVENLGENNPIPYVPYAMSYPWDFAKPSMFDADYIKLREISLSYQFPRNWLMKGVRDLSLSVYSRNLILWTKAKIGVDPERAFQAERSQETRGTQFKQGIERFNVDPWVIPVGFKIDITF